MKASGLGLGLYSGQVTHIEMSLERVKHTTEPLDTALNRRYPLVLETRGALCEHMQTQLNQRPIQGEIRSSFSLKEDNSKGSDWEYSYHGP